MQQPWPQQQQPMQQPEWSWKKNLWDFMAVALGFWIGRPSSRPEKVGVAAVSILVILLVVFA